MEDDVRNEWVPWKCNPVAISDWRRIFNRGLRLQFSDVGSSGSLAFRSNWEHKWIESSWVCESARVRECESAKRARKRKKTSGWRKAPTVSRKTSIEEVYGVALCKFFPSFVCCFLLNKCPSVLFSKVVVLSFRCCCYCCKMCRNSGRGASSTSVLHTKADSAKLRQWLIDIILLISKEIGVMWTNVARSCPLLASFLLPSHGGYRLQPPGTWKDTISHFPCSVVRFPVALGQCVKSMAMEKSINRKSQLLQLAQGAQGINKWTKRCGCNVPWFPLRPRNRLFASRCKKVPRKCRKREREREQMEWKRM